jgi:murein DD-endopeptidase MepM/ murein hydrolase activator NlpD
MWAAGTLGVGLGGWLGYFLWRQRQLRALGADQPVFPVEGANWPSAKKLQFGFERSGTHTHQGVDIAAPEGTRVFAALGGRVVAVCNQNSACSGFSGYGKVVVVETAQSSRAPRLWWLYAHLRDVGVSEGDPVRSGEPIGTVGRTYYPRSDPTANFSSGAHLHFEVSPREYPQDSEAWRYGPRAAVSALEGQQTWAAVTKTDQGALMAGVRA